MSPDVLLRTARLEAGLTQVDLAKRLGVTQPTVAAWERPGANPTVRTLERALGATGRVLTLVATGGADPRTGVDASLVREHLRRTPAERLRVLEALQRDAARFRRARRLAPDA